MIISLIKYHKEPVRTSGGLCFARSFEPELYSAKQGDVIVVGKTRDEVIKTILEKL